MVKKKTTKKKTNKKTTKKKTTPNPQDLSPDGADERHARENGTNSVPPEVLAQLKAELLNELQSEEERKRQAKIRAREEEKKAREEYVELMKASADPWVDIIGWVETSEGVRVELDWNQAFVNLLVDSGYVGRTDDQIVQQWITILLRDMADRMEDRYVIEDEI